MNTPTTPEQSGAASGPAPGSADDGACERCGRYYDLREGQDPTPFCDECAHAVVEELQDVVKAAWRLRFYGYHDWAQAGGVNNCHHGIGEGIHCARCDEILLRKSYERMTSPNGELSSEAKAPGK